MAWEPDYITVAQLKADWRDEESIDDVQYQRAVTSASRAIDLFTHRQFGKTAAPEARYYSPWYDEDLRMWVAWIDDMQSTTGIAVALDTSGDNTYTATLDASDYVLRPRNAVVKNRPFTQLAILPGASSQPLRQPDTLRVTVNVWGWTSIPLTIETAAGLQASRFATRRDAPFGIVGSPESKNQMRLKAELDPDVQVMVQEYQRPVWSK